MSYAFEMFQTGPDDAEMVIMTEDGVESVPMRLQPSIDLPCTGEEETAIWHLITWLLETDKERFFSLEIAFLQFDHNPGCEHFVAEEIRDLRAFLAEQQGTDRWNNELAGLLAKFEAAETELSE